MERIEVTRDLSDAEIYAIIDELIEESDPRRRLRLSDRWEMRKELFNSVRRLDVLQAFIDDDSITEIMVNGLQSIFIERSGRLFRCPEHFSSQEKLQDVIQRIVALSNRVANEAVPIVDARLENGARVNIVMSPVAVDGPAITIRRFPDHPILFHLRADLLREWTYFTRRKNQKYHKTGISCIFVTFEDRLILPAQFHSLRMYTTIYAYVSIF